MSSSVDADTMQRKLQDPHYLDLHLIAAASLAKYSQIDRYDAAFMLLYESAKAYLSEVRPDKLDEFIEAFEPLRHSPDFAVQHIDDLFDGPTHARIVAEAKSLQRGGFDDKERERFGRDIVHDHLYFLELQGQLLGLMEEMVGRELTTGYNFLSLYNGTGKCEMHMDEPYSMYTLDYCIEQSDEWPIYISNPIDWPSLDTLSKATNESLLNDPKLHFESHMLRPNNAVLFNGSSQWHYREPIAPGGFCNLLFFHYYPKGTESLIRPRLWTAYFDIAELAVFDDIMGSRFRGELAG